MSPEMDGAFERMWSDGVPVREIARILGYSENYLTAYASRNRERFPSRRRRVTEEQIARMRVLREIGMSMYRIAKEMGVSRSSVYNALLGKD